MSTPALRLRVSPQFPINVTADAGLGASITRNTLSIRNNWEGIGKTTPPSLVNYSRLVYNETLGTYERISELTTFAGGTLTTALNEAAPVTLASAGIVNIGAANANTISITGGATITGFDTIPAGAVRRLIFASALTLTHNAISLILPTGANITTAAGDAFVFLSLGSGNWRCMDYQLASGAALAMIIPDSSVTVGGNIVYHAGNVSLQRLPAVSAKSGAYTVVLGDHRTLFNCTGTFTMSLTSAATLADGFEFDIYNSGSGNITIDPNASETINGQPTAIVYPNGYLRVRCTGTAWTALGIDNNPTYRTPVPTTSIGLGQFFYNFFSSGAAVVLPGGGTWAYFAQGNSATGTLYTEAGGIAAGGSTVMPADGVRTAVRYWCWRIT